MRQVDDDHGTQATERDSGTAIHGANESRSRRFAVTKRRLVRAIILAVLLDVVICGAGAAIGAYELLALRSQLNGASTTHLVATVGALRDRLAVARIAFGAARVAFWPWRPVGQAISLLGGPTRIAGAAGPLLDLAADGATAAARALDGAAPALNALHSGHAAGDASVRLLDGVIQGHGAFAEALDAIHAAEADWATIDLAALPASWRARLHPVGTALPNADDALRAALAAPDLLGATRSRTYLLAPQNPWDLRATGGFVGTVALLEVRHGRVSLSASQPSDQVDMRRPGYTAPPLPLIVYAGYSNWFYRDANWSPDYPTSAALMRYFYWRGRGQTPDGVIAFDSAILKPLLQITGPVPVPGTKVVLSAATAVDVLDREINATGVVKKGFAAAAYSAVFNRLKHLTSSDLTRAAHALDQALRERHLLLWFADPAVSSILAHHGWDGAIDSTRLDYLYVVDTNVHFNKISHLIAERIAYHATVLPDRSLRSTVTIAYHNTATLADLRKPQNNTTYEDYIRVYVPLGSRLIGATGLTTPWPTMRQFNKQVFTGYLRLLSRQSATVTFSYIVPPNTLMNASTYGLTIQKQPGTDALPLSVVVRAGTPAIRVGGMASWSWSGARRTDVTLTAPLSGGRAAPQPLVYDASPRPTIAAGAQIEPGLALPSTGGG